MKPNHESIYLVPTDYDGGQLTYSWCDCPAPGEGMEPADAIKYVRADLVPASNEVLAKRIAELTNERDALVAQVEQLRDLLIRAVKGEQYIIESDLIAAIGSDLQSEISEAIEATPAHCLAEVKAQAGRDGFIAGAEFIQKGGYLSLPAGADEYANQIRQSAKVGEV